MNRVDPGEASGSYCTWLNNGSACAAYLHRDGEPSPHRLKEVIPDPTAETMILCRDFPPSGKQILYRMHLTAMAELSFPPRASPYTVVSDTNSDGTLPINSRIDLNRQLMGSGRTI